MRYLVPIVVALGVVRASHAQTPANLTTEQAAIVYDRCLARGAVRASRSDAADDAVYDLAKQECASTRASLIIGHEKDVERTETLDAIDADKAARFPALTRQIRERRKTYEPRPGSPK